MGIGIGTALLVASAAGTATSLYTSYEQKKAQKKALEDQRARLAEQARREQEEKELFEKRQDVKESRDSELKMLRRKGRMAAAVGSKQSNQRVAGSTVKNTLISGGL